MSNIDIYRTIFIESLDINKKDFSENLKYNDIPEWDSIGHMTLMSAIEEKFNITLETDDVVDFDFIKKVSSC